MENMLPNQSGSTIDLSSANDRNWYGFPFQIRTTTLAGEWNDPDMPTYWMALNVGGRFSARLGTNHRRRELTYVPGTFCAYPAGRQWDVMQWRSSPATLIVVACDWRLLRKSRLLDAEDLPRLNATHLCASDPGVTSIISSMVREYQDGSPSGRLFAESLSLALAARMHGLARDDNRRPSEGGLGRNRAKLVRDFIEEHLPDDISVADVAKLANLSPSRFAALFKDSFSVPVHRYVLNRRIERAMSLLKIESLRNADIAAACGFASESHFSDAFKRMTGASPSNYRRTNFGPTTSES
jgi:AraC family transcriptional regulator